MDPSTLAQSDDRPLSGKLTSDQTRRTFIKGIAAAGATTTAAVALETVGIDLFGEHPAQAATPNAFSDFAATTPSTADAIIIPEGFKQQVLIAWNDEFRNDDGTVNRYGFNCDFLAYFPIKGSDEGLLFVNHEYPAPFFQHGHTDPATKTPAQVAQEQYAVGNSIVHVKRKSDGMWEIVSPSPYNRRITGSSPEFQFTGTLANDPALPGIGEGGHGSLANCSGGITPWDTALSCEENYQDYAGTASAFAYGWNRAAAGNDEYYNGNGDSADAPTPYPANGGTGSAAPGPAKYGWVCEHDPFDASFTPRKHTSLGRFRHENTAFRHVPGKKFVLYMGDDRTDGMVYKFVSERSYKPGQRDNNLKILAEGQLYVARWDPNSRREFDAVGGNLVTQDHGTGYWVEVAREDLVDTYARIRARVGTPEANAHYATNRPEDVEVDADGTVYIAFTNHSGVNDVHGAIRRLTEKDNDPTQVGTANTFTWQDYAVGGPAGKKQGSQQLEQSAFSSPDNLVFDKAGNVWVVTDISSASLNKPTVPHYQYHANNGIFMVPRSGPNAGKAFRFGSMPAEAEGTGPYFTPDESTLFVNVQHPGEETPTQPGANPNDPTTFTSYWPDGNKSTGQNPGKPKPSTVAIVKAAPGEPGNPSLPEPPPGKAPDGSPAPSGGSTPPPAVPLVDTDPPGLSLALGATRLSKREFSRGVLVAGATNEAGTVAVALSGGQRKRATVDANDTFRLRVKPGRRLRLSLARSKKRKNVKLTVTHTDAAGNARTATRTLRVG